MARPNFGLSNICIVNGPPFQPAKSSGLFGTIKAQGLLKAHVFYGLKMFTPVNGLILLRAQIMFRPVKGPLWAHAYQKNLKAYANFRPDIFSGLHANFGP